MTFGIQTWRADGVAIITPSDAGGVFVGALSRSPAAGNGTVTYPDMNGRTLRVFQSDAGSFTWAVGVDGAGNPYITLTRLPPNVNDRAFGALVFAV